MRYRIHIVAAAAALGAALAVALPFGKADAISIPMNSVSDTAARLMPVGYYHEAARRGAGGYGGQRYYRGGAGGYGGQRYYRRQAWRYDRRYYGQRYRYPYRNYRYNYGSYWYNQPYLNFAIPFYFGPYAGNYGGGYYNDNYYDDDYGANRYAYYGGSSSRHIRWCANRYRSYNVRTNTWVSYSGKIRACISPYGP